MHFALLGNHPDGLALARALVQTGRHSLIAYSGPTKGVETLRDMGLSVKPIGDMEEVLADPAVELVIVAGRPADRGQQLRRALQSERPVLCVHPADASADLGYEAAMLQQDTKQVLLPLLPETRHPAIARLAELVRAEKGPLGEIRLVELERWAKDRVLIDTDPHRPRPSLPGWDVLRALGGEIAEVSAFAPQEEVSSDDPLLLSGRFENGTLLRAAFLPRQVEERWRLTVTGSRAEVTLTFAGGWPGPATLNWHDATGQLHEENWNAWDPWTPLVEVFEQAIGAGANPAATPALRQLSWQDAVRCLELDGAVRRSVHYRRASALEYQEASEEVGFKGTMTLVGCGLLWGILFLLLLSAWQPYFGWLIVPLLVVFLGLQFLRWIIPQRQPPAPGGR
jgi:predicted dehydrogenase